jgi:ribosomal protein RSM22 (predicted rRNA methylase)
VDGEVGQEVVSKRQGDRYRAARDTSWGDPLP